mgnify:CR=1 FL=1
MNAKQIAPLARVDELDDMGDVGRVQGIEKRIERRSVGRIDGLDHLFNKAVGDAEGFFLVVFVLENLVAHAGPPFGRNIAARGQGTTIGRKENRPRTLRR